MSITIEVLLLDQQLFSQKVKKFPSEGQGEGRIMVRHILSESY
jgi:hypothetical protein